jgi:hypothetical protein
MKPMSLLQALIVVIAGAVTLAVACGVFNSASRAAMGLTVYPFAYQEVFLAHLVFALPLAWLVSRWMKSLLQWQHIWVGWQLAFACITTVASVWGTQSLGTGLDGVAGSFTAAGLCRTAIAVALLVPWLMAWHSTGTLSPAWLAWAAAGLLATLPTGLYTSQLLDQKLGVARDAHQRQRLATLQPLLLGILELGSTTPIERQPLDETYNSVLYQTKLLENLIAIPLGDRPSSNAIILRASQYVQLGRLTEAQTLLDDQNLHDSVDAKLLRAVIAQEQTHWEQSTLCFERVWIECTAQAAGVSKNSDENARIALEGLIYNATRQQQRAETEKWLIAGATHFVELAPEFELRRAEVELNAGLSVQAKHRINQLNDLNNPVWIRQRDALLSRINLGTPGCLLR